MRWEAEDLAVHPCQPVDWQPLPILFSTPPLPTYSSPLLFCTISIPTPLVHSLTFGALSFLTRLPFWISPFEHDAGLYKNFFTVYLNQHNVPSSPACHCSSSCSCSSCCSHTYFIIYPCTLHNSHTLIIWPSPHRRSKSYEATLHLEYNGFSAYHCQNGLSWLQTVRVHKYARTFQPYSTWTSSGVWWTWWMHASLCGCCGKGRGGWGIGVGFEKWDWAASLVWGDCSRLL